MNQINKTLLAIVIVVGGVLSASAINPALSTLATAATGECGCGGATETAPCGCGAETTPCGCEAVECETCVDSTPCTKKRGCRCKRCRKPRKKISCPSCAVECDTCTLKLDHYEEDKTCFKTEQKIICIPPVRFPWEECCPPGRTNKTRAVNVLKVHKYKCKSCGYKWELDKLPEPVNPTAPADAATEADTASDASNNAVDAPAGVDPVVAPVDEPNLLSPTEAPRPDFEPTEAPMPGFNVVPQAPAG